MSKWYRSFNSELAFIGDANWDIYATADDTLIALAKPDSGASDSHFGDREHVRKLMANGWFDCTPTERGLEIMSGLYSCLLPSGNYHLKFHKG